MADARFHTKSQPLLLGVLAAACECTLANTDDAGFKVDDVAPLDQAGPSHISFLSNRKYRDEFLASKAGACIVSQDAANDAPKGMKLLIAKDPYRAYAKAATLLYPYPQSDGLIADTAVIDGIHGVNCSIGHHAIISREATIGDNCIIEAGAYIGPGVVIGSNSWIGPNATITHAVLGQNVRIHTGVRIGQDGFGFAMGADHVPVPQLGRVVIGNHVNIGANTCIDRGAGPDTIIGDGCIIDNLCQIGHNVKLGRGCVLVSQVGISGSTILGDYAVMGGQAGVAGHLNIGAGAQIAAQSGVIGDVPAGEEWVGFPAMPRMAFWRMQAGIKKLLGQKG
ncbi:MAG TPA: UDP-3-O-(3-hydroxymyristoyl)glucosamine N-acyltransferase [Alphaproteobacteria bacterium]